MAERSIIFSAPMVRALLDGGKTQTRRLVTRHTVEVLGERWGPNAPWSGLRFNEAWARENSPISGSHMPHLAVPFCHPDDEPEATEACGIYRITPVVEIGDRLWVQEAWKPHSCFAHLPPRDIPPTNIFYAADQRYAPSNTPWKSGIHMPRWASRLTLLVTDVRVQRLQEISEEDAQAEGVECFSEPGLVWWRGGGPQGAVSFEGARDAFRDLWDSLNAKRAPWNSNPWVIALTFEVQRGNIDAPANREAE